MSQNTLTRAEISARLSEKLDLPRDRTNEILEAVLEEMLQAVVKEGNLKLSSFGSFSVRKKNQRIGRNPKTGKEVMITPRRTTSFQASNKLKERVIKVA